MVGEGFPGRIGKYLKPGGGPPRGIWPPGFLRVKEAECLFPSSLLPTAALGASRQ